MDLNELEKLLDLLRRKGVTEFEGHNPATYQDFKIKLGAANEPEVVELPSNKPNSHSMGKDGLTRQQQEELYGQPVDEFEG